MTNPFVRPAASAFALAMLWVGVAGAADDYDAGTKTALQGVVSKQLDALGRGDGVAAEAFAAPGIRSQFPDPGKFLDMVKGHYAALIKPKSTTFTGVETSPHGPLQKMTVVAADGTVWSAIYSFEKVDGEWRITGCALEEDKDQQAI